MNKSILILGIFVLAATTFAYTIYNPYLNVKLWSADCQYNAMWSDMNYSVAHFNASKGPAMVAIGSAMADMLYYHQNLSSQYCVYNNTQAFNSQYNSVFNPLMAQATALYFRAAFDDISNGGTSWSFFWGDYQKIQGDYRDCLAYWLIPHPVNWCAI